MWDGGTVSGQSPFGGAVAPAPASRAPGVNPLTTPPCEWFGEVMTILDARTTDILEVVALSDSAWQVCDSRIAPDDASRVFARVERTPDYFLVMWNAPSDGWAAFPTFEAARRALQRSRSGSFLAA